MKIKIILTKEKVIRGKVVKAGTALGEVTLAKDYTQDDIAKAIQLNQIGISTILEKKEEITAPKKVKANDKK